MVDLPKSVLHFFFECRQAAMDSNTTAYHWLGLIKQGEALTPRQMSWPTVCGLVQMAIVGGQGDKLKALVLEQYEAARRINDDKASDRLVSLARMFDDKEFEARFEHSKPKLNPIHVSFEELDMVE